MNKIFYYFLGIIFASISIYRLQVAFPNFGELDLYQFWVASRLVVEGGNPYNVSELARFSHQINSLKPVDSNFYYPPSVFVLLRPLASISIESSRIFFALMNLLLCALPFYLLREHGTRGNAARDLFVLLTFFPLYLVIWIGQTSMVPVVGWSLILASLRSFSVKGFLSSHLLGIGIALTLYKAHLGFLCYIPLALYLFKYARFSFIPIAGWIVLFFLTPLLLNTQIYLWFLEKRAHSPLQWLTPSLNSFLVSYFLPFFPQMKLITALATALIAALWVLQKAGRPELLVSLVSLFIPLSLAATPYCWTYDFSILAPATLAYLATAKFSLSFLLIHLAANVVLLFSPMSMQFHFWYPLIYLLLFLGVGTYRAEKRLKKGA